VEGEIKKKESKNGIKRGLGLDLNYSYIKRSLSDPPVAGGCMFLGLQVPCQLLKKLIVSKYIKLMRSLSCKPCSAAH